MPNKPCQQSNSSLSAKGNMRSWRLGRGSVACRKKRRKNRPQAMTSHRRADECARGAPAAPRRGVVLQSQPRSLCKTVIPKSRSARTEQEGLRRSVKEKPGKHYKRNMLNSVKPPPEKRQQGKNKLRGRFKPSEGPVRISGAKQEPMGKHRRSIVENGKLINLHTLLKKGSELGRRGWCHRGPHRALVAGQVERRRRERAGEHGEQPAQPQKEVPDPEDFEV